jgi:transglutaminase/protease-like cytokinesis protein 3
MTVPQPPFRVRTIYSWSGTEEDDLGFIEGDIIEVDNLGDGNWWHGRLKRNKMTGNFPSNYVELIKSDLANFSSSIRAGFKSGEPDDPRRSTSPQSPYSKNQVSSPNRQPQHDYFEEDMQFSFQSSRNYYDPQQHQRGPAPQSPYSSFRVPHSRSVPNRLQQEKGRVDQPKLSREATPPYDQQQRGYSYNAPPPPHHAVPVKSKSSFNLTTARDSCSPDPPYKDSARKSNLLRQAQQNQRSQEFVAPYDPETLNQSKSSGSQSSNVFSYSNGSYFTSSQSSNESAFAMSDFSATSAGSYSRHQWEEQQRRSAMNTSASGNPLLVEEKRVKNPTGLLRKFFSTKDAPPLPSVEQLARNMNVISVEDKKMNSWIEFKIDLNRANSLSVKERQMREKRVRENEGYIILEPHKQLSTINNNEVYQTEHKIDLHAINLKHVDTFVRKLKPQSASMSPEAFITNELGMKYSSKLEYLRALFILCTETFTIAESRSSEHVENPNIEDLFHRKRGKPYEMAYLFKYLSDLMGLKSELTEGSLKTPQAIVRHYWNAVLINGEWRFIDVSMGNLTNPIYEILANKMEEPSESFFFLAEPLDLIYTHIPDKYEHQHIVPPIDPMVALALPPCFPSFFKNGIKIHKFSNALTRLQGFETFEVDLKVPKDIEVNAVVMTKTSAVKTLAQIYWKHNERFCKVKGHLPDNNSTGFVNIYSGLKGTQKSLQNIHPLSMVIPITHEGEYRPLDFVVVYPTVPAQMNDLYIKQPQNRNLSYNAEYVFTIAQHPSKGLNTVSAVRPKIAIQSPSGKIIKFVKKDLSTPFGTWELPIKCNETGVWRGLVSIDSGTSLCVFAEWMCE